MLTRRDFLETSLGAAAAVALPPVFRGDPYQPIGPFRQPPTPGRPVRVRGRVSALGKGLRGVSLSDGLSVTTTDAEGRYQLLTESSHEFVTLSVPSSYQLPTHPSGTVRCYHRIQPDPRGEMAASFELTPIPGGDDRHRFLLLADIQTQDSPDLSRFLAETVPDVKATVARLKDLPLFGVSDGDIAWDELALYDDYERAVLGIGIPFVQVVGNHDLDLKEQSDEGSTTTFERRFGPRNYSFNRGQLHYVVLDDVFYYDGGYLGYLTNDQLTWLAADLAPVEPGAPVVVFLHIPAFTTFAARQGRASPNISTIVTNREALYRVLEPYRALLLSGHLHESDYVVQGNVVERNHGTVCGGWWTGDICYDGTPNGYGVYEVNGGDIRWQYKSTGQDFSYQLRVYPLGADPTAPDEIVANVWQWDPSWTVSWYEDGQRKGLMSRRAGMDPLAAKLMSGPDLPAKRGWVDPVRTGHLFYAPTSSTVREVRVEAVDRWGRTYVSRVTD